MKPLRRFAFALALLLGARPAAAQVARLLPVDEAQRDPTFVVFRDRLREAVREHDAEFVHGILAPDILNSFGGDGGVEEFREKWDADHPASELWSTLDAILSHGGAFIDGDSVFAAPYVYSRWPEGFDVFEYAAIVGSDVRVRGRPFLGAPVIAALSHDVVPLAPDPGSPGFDAIRLADGRVGYVAVRYLRTPVDYRALFVKRGGRWLLKALVAGD